METGMKESDREDQASHSGLDPNAAGGDIGGVASGRGDAGQPLSSEIKALVGRSRTDRGKWGQWSNFDNSAGAWGAWNRGTHRRGSCRGQSAEHDLTTSTAGFQGRRGVRTNCWFHGLHGNRGSSSVGLSAKGTQISSSTSPGPGVRT